MKFLLALLFSVQVFASSSDTRQIESKQLKLDGATSGNILLKAADVTTNYALKFPGAQGGASTTLQNDGSGNLSWGSSGGADTALSNLASVAINTNLVFGVTGAGVAGYDAVISSGTNGSDSGNVTITAPANGGGTGAVTLQAANGTGGNTAAGLSLAAGNGAGGSGGSVAILSGDANANHQSGNILIQTGNSNGGGATHGSITLSTLHTGQANLGGAVIVLADNTVSCGSGCVWTESDSAGTGGWAVAASIPSPLEATASYSGFEAGSGSFFGAVSDSDQSVHSVVLGSTDTAINGNKTSNVALVAGDQRGASSTGAPGHMLITAGSVNTGTAAGGFTIIAGGSADSGAGGAVGILSGASNSGTNGDITLNAAGSGPGASGNIILITQTGTPTGDIRLQDTTQSCGSGCVWTEADTAGTGHWVAASGVTTVGTFSGSSQTNGAAISGSTITFGPADGSNPGMVTTGTQTMAGAKTFSTSLTSPIFQSSSATPATTGVIRLANADVISWKNQSGGVNIAGITVDTNNHVVVGANLYPNANESLSIGDNTTHFDTIYSRVYKWYSGTTQSGEAGANSYTLPSGTTTSFHFAGSVASSNPLGIATASQSGLVSAPINIETGNSSGNDSGGISLLVGTSGATQGTIKFLKSGVASVSGDVWQASAVDGTGYWATPRTLGTSTVNIFVDTLGHIISKGTAPTITANCGSSPSVAGTDVNGRITVGTGGSDTSCTLTFANAYTTAPTCTVGDETTILLLKAVASTSTLVISSATPLGASDTLVYNCLGY